MARATGMAPVEDLSVVVLAHANVESEPKFTVHLHESDSRETESGTLTSGYRSHLRSSGGGPSREIRPYFYDYL